MARPIPAIMAGILILLTSVGCGYNKLQGLDEEVKSAWAEVLNQYQRRFDLIPNLVNTVKGYASHEKETLQAVVEARAKVGQMQVDASTLDNPEAFQVNVVGVQLRGRTSSSLSRHSGGVPHHALRKQSSSSPRL